MAAGASRSGQHDRRTGVDNSDAAGRFSTDGFGDELYKRLTAYLPALSTNLHSIHNHIYLMSTMHMPFDDSGYYLHHPRDLAEYDMAMALELRPIPLGQPPFAEHFDEFMHPFAASMMEVPPNVAFDDDAFALQQLQHFQALRHGDLDVRHPVPRRPLSPGMLYPPGHPWYDPVASSGHPSIHADGSGSVPPSSITNPSMFAPLPESRSAAQSVASDTDEPPPPPPPSWAMSGSLDPATGIYQTSPEHPRVRTQQACEKCRGRKAKVLPFSPIVT